MPITPQDWIEIANLCARYCLLLDASDGEGMASIFTEDGVCVIPERSFTGPAELSEMATSKDRSKWRHLATSPLIEGEGDTATGRSYVLVVSGPNDRKFDMHTHGTYEDDFIRTPDGWKFKRRNIIRAHRDDFDLPVESKRW